MVNRGTGCLELFSSWGEIKGRFKMIHEHIEIVVGTYEEFILGYKFTSAENESCSLIQTFANHSHRASIRCLGTGGKYLASGGADEDIHLYDVESRRESGILGYHDGTVTCLEFTPNGSHLLSGCEKGVITVCRSGNWQVEKQWRAAHKGLAVTSLTVHPTGKLALSVGRDGRLRTWNLIKGRQAYATHLALDKYKQVSCVKWSPSGDLYAVLLLCRIDVYSMKSAGVVYSTESSKKLVCICFLNDDILCVGDEEGTLSMHSIQANSLLQCIRAHENRIKCMDRVNAWLVSASSSGIVKLWSLKTDGSLSEMSSVNTGCRITCIILLCGRNTSSVVMKESSDTEAPILSKAVRRKKGVVVQLSHSVSSLKKKDTDLALDSSTKPKLNKKKNRKGKFLVPVKESHTRKKKKLKGKQASLITTTVTDSCGQKWVVDDIS